MPNSPKGETEKDKPPSSDPAIEEKQTATGYQISLTVTGPTRATCLVRLKILGFDITKLTAAPPPPSKP